MNMSEAQPLRCPNCDAHLVIEPVFPGGTGIEHRQFVRGCHRCLWVDPDSIAPGVTVDRDVRGHGLASLPVASGTSPEEATSEPSFSVADESDEHGEADDATESEGSSRPPDHLIGLFPFRNGPQRLEGDRWACLIGLRRAAERLGHSPSQREYMALEIRPPYRFLVTTHGSYNEAKYQAGLKTVSPADTEPFTRAECYEALRAAKRTLGHAPSKADYQRLGLAPSVSTICRLHDGSWNDPKRIAGLEVDPRGRPCESRSTGDRDRGSEADDPHDRERKN